MMHRYFIAGALACFGPSLFGQTIPSSSNQTKVVPNQIQSTLQNGIQGAQDRVERGIERSSGTAVLGNGQNSSSLNAQGQVNGAPVLNGSAGMQNNTGLQNNANRQPVQLNSNQSTQFQGQSPVGQQGGSSFPQNNYNQQSSSFQTNGNNGSQGIQRSGPQMRPGQLQGQTWSAEANQNVRSIQNRPQTESRNSTQADYLQQFGQSQNSDPVYILRFDASGREFICVNGRPVYFDSVNSISAQGNFGTQNKYRAGYGSYDLKDGQNSQDQTRNPDQAKTDQQTSGAQSSVGDQTNSRTNPANSQKSTNSDEVAAPTPERLDADSQNQTTERRIDGETKPGLDADTARPSDVLNGLPKPKP